MCLYFSIKFDNDNIFKVKVVKRGFMDFYAYIMHDVSVYGFKRTQIYGVRKL